MSVLDTGHWAVNSPQGPYLRGTFNKEEEVGRDHKDSSDVSISISAARVITHEHMPILEGREPIL